MISSLLSPVAASAYSAADAAPATPEPVYEAAETAATLSAGDTAWMLTATALVLFMTLPGLALFYGGLVRSKNVLNVLVSCFALAGVMSILWVVVGYSLAFTGDGEANNGFIGGLDKALLAGIGVDTLSGTIPEALFAVFQMTFFIITPALIIGGVAERMKFGAMLLFCIGWGLLSYLPICHMAWTEGGLFETWHVADFAGGTVVHINAGIAALVAAIMVGSRKGYPQQAMKPHSLVLTAIGGGMLWVGWFGFNAGSAGAADGSAAMAMLVTQLAAGTGAVTWMVIEWIKHGKPSALGIVSGAIGGLVGITPASGTVGVVGALAIGACCGLGCYWGAVHFKHWIKVDDSLDAFGVHGIGGIIGAVLTGVFMAEGMGGLTDVGTEGGTSIGAQVWWQFASVLVTIAWSGVVSVVLLLLIKATIGLRVDETGEAEGLDLALHDEQGYLHE